MILLHLLTINKHLKTIIEVPREDTISTVSSLGGTKNNPSNCFILCGGGHKYFRVGSTVTIFGKTDG